MGRPLFEGFLGTLKLSDSLHPCITVVPRGFTVRAWRSLVRSDAGPPGFRTQCFGACQRSPTPPGASTPCHDGVSAVAFRVFGARRHPGLARFRGSILCLHLPLSTLRQRRYRRLRMTRGQCGWLDLHCLGLSPFTTAAGLSRRLPERQAWPPRSRGPGGFGKKSKRRACGVSSAGPYVLQRHCGQAAHGAPSPVWGAHQNSPQGALQARASRILLHAPPSRSSQTL